MRRVDIKRLYKLSNATLDKLVEIGAIEYKDKDYSLTWGEVQLFKPSDIATFLSRVTREYWGVRRVMYVHEDMFFDLHQGKCERKLNRITLHDFRSIVESVNPDLLSAFDKHYDLQSVQLD